MHGGDGKRKSPRTDHCWIQGINTPTPHVLSQILGAFHGCYTLLGRSPSARSSQLVAEAGFLPPGLPWRGCMSCLKTSCCFTKGVVLMAKTPQKWNKPPWLQSLISQPPDLFLASEGKLSGAAFSFPFLYITPFLAEVPAISSDLFFCLPDLRLIQKTVFVNASGVSPSLK